MFYDAFVDELEKIAKKEKKDWEPHFGWKGTGALVAGTGAATGGTQFMLPKGTRKPGRAAALGALGGLLTAGGVEAVKKFKQNLDLARGKRKKK